MSIFSKLFSKPKKITRHIDGLGEFVFFNDEEDSYWEVERPLLNLPTGFDFGAIEGNVDSIDSGAINEFIVIAQDPDKLFDMLGSAFLTKIEAHFDELTLVTVRNEFYIKSLTISNKLEYEFGLHSRSKDIFVELFVRNGRVSEVHLDEGCCSV
jgi:hypothetical protein